MLSYAPSKTQREINKFWENRKELKNKMLNYYESNKSLLLDNEYLTVHDVLLKPFYGIMESRKDINITKPLLMTAPMDTVTSMDQLKNIPEGLEPVLSRVYLKEYLEEIKGLPNKETGLWIQDRYFISIGANETDFELLKEIIKYRYSPPNVCLDIAHGYSINGMTYIKLIKDIIKLKWPEKPFRLMCGSIATGEAAQYLIKCGITDLRVGIGGGQMCSTRNMTGVGVPNLSAVFEVYDTIKDMLEYQNNNINIIADGGVRDPSDIVKYLCAGANKVMIGTAFASCSDSPAKLDEQGRKLHRGQASSAFQKEHIGYIRNNCPEGVERHLKIEGTIQEKVDYFYGGIRSAISYLGGENEDDLNINKVQFIRVTPNAYFENNPMRE